IPEGQYGGGTVMVWDIGTYDIVAGNYWKGDLTIYITGRKLKGEWHLTRNKAGDDQRPVWRLEKSGKRAKPITAKQDDQSATTGRTMAEIAAANDAQWQSDRAATTRTV